MASNGTADVSALRDMVAETLRRARRRTGVGVTTGAPAARPGAVPEQGGARGRSARSGSSAEVVCARQQQICHEAARQLYEARAQRRALEQECAAARVRQAVLQQEIDLLSAQLESVQQLGATYAREMQQRRRRLQDVQQRHLDLVQVARELQDAVARITLRARRCGAGKEADDEHP